MTSKLALVFLASSGCATAHLVGPPAMLAPDPNVARTVVLEPFFESADWRTSMKTEYAQVPLMTEGLYGTGTSNAQVAITREVAEKPLYAQAGCLADEHRQLLNQVQKLRPTWTVTSTSGTSVLAGPTTLVRVVVGDFEVMESDRTLKKLAFGFGLIIWPLQLVNLNPVHESQRVYGVLNRFDADAAELKPRLVRYPTQPDFAVNTSGWLALERRFGLDITYEEGVMADDRPRDAVLLKGFVERLAAAVVAIVEEQR